MRTKAEDLFCIEYTERPRCAVGVRAALSAEQGLHESYARSTQQQNGFSQYREADGSKGWAENQCGGVEKTPTCGEYTVLDLLR